ncbi:MAG TPA: hypothetical protein DD429_05965 [Clostridiaceae bacterium]|nr:hypothetical protein [Clostridiaceae bacterium]
MAQKVKVTLISLKHPCTACLITYGLIKEILEKIRKDFDFVEIEYLELEDLKHIHSIPGLEVEKFPALLINDEQITAGSLPMKKQLITIIKSEAGIYEKN